MGGFRACRLVSWKTKRKAVNYEKPFNLYADRMVKFQNFHIDTYKINGFYFSDYLVPNKLIKLHSDDFYNRNLKKDSIFTE